jgi:hypothetical protein
MDIRSTKQKALHLNLDSTIYGTFAEIGAGQEVAGQFFRAGGASGTIAKSISAYDMIFSDSIYGKEESGRYVCQSRLEKMLNYEFTLLEERLREHRSNAKFFAFANTVSARNYLGTNDPHGWIGIKFCHEVGAAPSELIIHVRMLDLENLQQQDALGVIGVNLVYTAYHCRESIKFIISCLMEELSAKRLELDMISVKGPAFSHIDNRLLNLQLVKEGITNAILFNEDGSIGVPSEQFYKKNIIVVRGSYRPPTLVNMDMIEAGKEAFIKTCKVEKSSVFAMAEITINNLSHDGDITNEDFLARVDLLASLNQKVLVSNYPQYYKLAGFFKAFKAQKIAIVLGAYNFQQIFNHDYHDMHGGILEAMGLMFRENVHVYLYPYKEEGEKELITFKNLPVDKKHEKLLDYLRSLDQVHDIEKFNTKIQDIFSRKVLNLIAINDPTWESMVPVQVARTINEKCLFGHPCAFDPAKKFID